MKVFGSLTELVSLIFRKNSQQITLRPSQTTTYTATRTVDLPPQDAAAVIVSESATQTLTNKTLTSPVINTPTGITKSDVGLGNVDNTSDASKNSATVTLTNKTISGASNTLTNIPAGTALTGQVPTANGGTGVNSTATFPTSGIVVTEAGTETLSNKTLDTTNSVGVKDTLFSIVDDGDITKAIQFQASGITTGQTRILTVPDASLTLVGTATTQTLTNKTLTSPTVGTLALFDNQAEARFAEATGSGTDYFGIKAPSSLTTTTTMTLPDGVGTSGQFLQTNGSNAMTWATPSGSSAATTSVLGTVYLPNAEIRMYGINSAGGSTSGDTRIQNFSNTITSVGTGITYTARTTTAGDKFTINEAGVYAITTSFYDSNNFIGISVNSSQTSTAIGSTTASTVLGADYCPSGDAVNVIAIARLAVNDVVRAHRTTTSAVTDSTNAAYKFCITQLFRTA